MGYVVFYMLEMIWECLLDIVLGIIDGGMVFYGGLIGVVLVLWYFVCL